jgi:hypothetical protein
MNEKEIGMELSLESKVTALVLIDLQRSSCGGGRYARL